MKNTQTPSRASRSIASVFIALIATIVAATSHMLAGGNTPTVVALIATFAISLPLVTLLTSKRAGIFGTLIAVSITQAIFHNVFVYAGTGLTIGSSTPEPLHAAHMRALESFVPNIDALDLDHHGGFLMFAMHALASIGTVWLIHQGQEALNRLALKLGRIFWPQSIFLTHEPIEFAPFAAFSPSPKKTSLIFTDSLSLRGPPAHV